MLGPLMLFTSVSIDSILRNMWSFDVIRDAGAIEIIEKLTWQNQLNQLAMLDIDQLETTLSEPFEVSRFRLHRTSVVDRPNLQTNDWGTPMDPGSEKFTGQELSSFMEHHGTWINGINDQDSAY